MANAIASTLFCVRNTNKVENGDLGRAPVAIGQARNVVNSIMACDNAVGKTANTAVDAFNMASKSDKLLKNIGKGVRYFGDHINPLICVSAGAKVLLSDDPTTVAIEQGAALSSMFAGERFMKKNLQSGIDNSLLKINKFREKKELSKTFEKVDKVLEKCKLKGKVSKIAYGVTFVLGSCMAYGIGEKVGKGVSAGIKTEDKKIEEKS